MARNRLAYTDLDGNVLGRIKVDGHGEYIICGYSGRKDARHLFDQERLLSVAIL